MQRFSILFTVLVSVIAMAISGPATAQTATSPAQPPQPSAGGACGRPMDLPDKLPADQVDQFKSDPQGLLKHNPIGGLDLSGEVKGLAVSDPASSVDKLLEAARSSNSMQAAAIGTGLGQAVKAIMPFDKACADEIARKIAGAGLSDLMTGYNLAQAGSTTFLSGTDEGVGGGIGGTVNGASTASTGTSGATTSARSSVSTANIPETFSFSGSTGTCSSSVSPRRRC